MDISLCIHHIPILSEGRQTEEKVVNIKKQGVRYSDFAEKYVRAWNERDHYNGHEILALASKRGLTVCVKKVPRSHANSHGVRTEVSRPTTALLDGRETGHTICGWNGSVVRKFK